MLTMTAQRARRLVLTHWLSQVADVSDFHVNSDNSNGVEIVAVYHLQVNDDNSNGVEIAAVCDRRMNADNSNGSEVAAVCDLSSER